MTQDRSRGLCRTKGKSPLAPGATPHNADANTASLPKIKEILVVEGRDDTAAIKKSVDAITIETHGYGITNKTWKLME